MHNKTLASFDTVSDEWKLRIGSDLRAYCVDGCCYCQTNPPRYGHAGGYARAGWTANAYLAQGGMNTWAAGEGGSGPNPFAMDKYWFEPGPECPEPPSPGGIMYGSRMGGMQQLILLR